jgi:signal transduction histidine kinase
VLRFSRGEAGATAIRTERRDVVADVSDTIAAFQPLAAAADATVTLVADGRAFAWTDAGAVRQVVLNLLDNAIKYGPAGQTVTVRVVAEGADAIISIEDEGAGIPASDRQRVFEPFARLDRPGLPRVSGSGIGLSIVRDLVTAHDGRVWVDPGDNGRGTRVSFTVALAQAGDAQPSPPIGRSRHRVRAPQSVPEGELEGIVR